MIRILVVTMSLLLNTVYAQDLGSISGVVRNSAGESERAIFVQARNIDTGMGVTVLTDNTGEYEIGGLPAGSYAMRIDWEVDDLAKQEIFSTFDEDLHDTRQELLSNKVSRSELQVKKQDLEYQKMQFLSEHQTRLDNIEELGWQLYLCSSPPYHLQTKNDKRMDEYTRLAFDGKFDEARRVRDSLNPVREAMIKSKPADKPQAFGKYWQELVGQVGGRVRPPMLELTDTEKSAIKAAFETCGLKV